eukprot:scaffold2830_cov173-Amphora_coffeaeformis.AAC.5
MRKPRSYFPDCTISSTLLLLELANVNYYAKAPRTGDRDLHRPNSTYAGRPFQYEPKSFTARLIFLAVHQDRSTTILNE